MNKVLVIGDLILDHNTFGTATRLCPEAPVPVIVPDGPPKITRGGAGLVTDQLRELIGKENVIAHFGSKSIKKRTFADGRLICRVDHDSVFVSPREAYERAIGKSLLSGVGLLIISDYGKGALDQFTARQIMLVAEGAGIPVFVDAKNNWSWYFGAFAMFPNQREKLPVLADPKHVIQKLGADGCAVDGFPVRSISEHAVMDTTGAGDIFLAAFAYAFREYSNWNSSLEILIWSAEIANDYAGRSVGYIGTKIVKKAWL